MANLAIGIIGLPNVGKSTLFQALTAVEVAAENYPFCTIDPNVGLVEVPDPRLDRIHEIAGEGKARVPAVVEFVDIAGLAEGASRGEGLGNRFLHHVREADALLHVVRAFEDESVVRTGGASTDPLRDREIVETELALADLETVGRGKSRRARKVRGGEKEAAAELELLERVEAELDAGEPVRRLALRPEEEKTLRPLGLLTGKPVMFVLNVGESGLAEEAPPVRRFRETLEATDPGTPCLVISAELEAEVAQLPPGERAEYLRLLGLEESGLGRVVRTGYDLLGLRTFFTIGDAEVRAWTVPAGARAPEAAGRVHTDFERGFIRAETVGCEEFLAAGSLKEARKRGLVRSEGKEYVVQDGEILLFRAAR
ncbi:MAG: redox-regulated ATPase YchF [Gemmatimonadota bacterium]